MRQQCPLCAAAEIGAYRQVERVYGQTHYDLQLGRCARCQFVFLLDIPPVLYDDDYLQLEKVVTVGNSFARFHAEERLAGIARFVPLVPERKFLDIGIGDGLLLSLAEQAGYAAYGLDVNPAGVERARLQYRLRAEVSLAPVDQAYPGFKFDVIHMNEVIEHVPEPMPLLRWCRAHLRPQGCLVIQTGNIDSLVSRIMGAHWDYYRPVHVGYYSTRTLTFAVERAGFSALRGVTMDWRPGAVLKYVRQLRAGHSLAQAVKFVLFYLTVIPHGLRRTVVVYAG